MIIGYTAMKKGHLISNQEHYKCNILQLKSLDENNEMEGGKFLQKVETTDFDIARVIMLTMFNNIVKNVVAN